MLKYNYFPGCTLKTTAKQLEISAINVGKILEFELVELPRWHCCGTVVTLASDDKIRSIGAIRTLIRAQETGDDKLVTICSVCLNTLRRINARFRDDDEFRDAVLKFMDDEPPYEGNIKVLHYVDILLELGLDKLRKAVKRKLEGLKVGAYYGCLLLRPAEFSIDPNTERPTVLEQIIATTGAEVVDFPLKIECCGSFETVHKPDFVAQRTYEIVESARRAGAETIVTFCPLCHFNLDRRQKIIMQVNPGFKPMPILYFTELLELALSEEELSWEGHEIDVSDILRRYTTIKKEA